MSEPVHPVGGTDQGAVARPALARARESQLTVSQTQAEQWARGWAHGGGEKAQALMAWYDRRAEVMGEQQDEIWKLRGQVEALTAELRRHQEQGEALVELLEDNDAGSGDRTTVEAFAGLIAALTAERNKAVQEERRISFDRGIQVAQLERELADTRRERDQLEAQVRADWCPECDGPGRCAAGTCAGRPFPQAEPSSVQRDTTEPAQESDHHYLSTACEHGLHDQCRLTCKYCGTGCLCSHHRAAPPSAGPVETEVCRHGKLLTVPCGLCAGIAERQVWTPGDPLVNPAKVRYLPNETAPAAPSEATPPVDLEPTAGVEPAASGSVPGALRSGSRTPGSDRPTEGSTELRRHGDPTPSEATPERLEYQPHTDFAHIIKALIFKADPQARIDMPPIGHSVEQYLSFGITEDVDWMADAKELAAIAGMRICQGRGHVYWLDRVPEPAVTPEPEAGYRIPADAPQVLASIVKKDTAAIGWQHVHAVLDLVKSWRAPAPSPPAVPSEAQIERAARAATNAWENADDGPDEWPSVVRAVVAALAEGRLEEDVPAPCTCGHLKTDHVANIGVCRERDRFAPCGCESYTRRPIGRGGRGEG